MSRTKRAHRVARALPDITGDLRELTEQIHRYNPLDGGPVFHVNRGELESLSLATPFTVTRDDNALARSNFAIISADLDRVSPFGTDILRFSHWGFGWYERVYVRRDDAAALMATQQWIHALASYPVADDAHYDDLEWAEHHPADGDCYSDNPDCPCRGRRSEPLL